jgi:hypothetical protein
VTNTLLLRALFWAGIGGLIWLLLSAVFSPLHIDG